MEVKQHSNWGHGLHPGEAFDMNCIACQKERESMNHYQIEYVEDGERHVIEVEATDELTALFRAGYELGTAVSAPPSLRVVSFGSS